MKIAQVTALSIMVGLLSALLVSPLAASSAVVVTALAGRAEHRASPTAAWTVTKRGQQLAPGAQLRTARASGAEMRFPDGTTFRLGPESAITIAAASPATANVPRGSVFARVVKGSLVRIQGAYGAATVRGTTFAYEVTDEGELLRTWDGSVEFGPEGETIGVAEGMGSWLFPRRAPGRPQAVAPEQFGGMQLHPPWRQLRTGVDISATQGTEGQRAQAQQQSDLGEAIVTTQLTPPRKGSIEVELEQVRAAQAQGARAAGDGAAEALAAGAAAAAAGAAAKGPRLERSVGDWLFGPVGAFGAYGLWSNEQSFAGARAKVSAVVKEVYVQAAGRYAVASDERAEWLLDETFGAYRREDVELMVGRLRLLEGPAGNSDVGSLLPFTTVDGARLGFWIGPRVRGTLSWLHDFDSVFEEDRRGQYGRLQYFSDYGWLGVAALRQEDARTGVTGQFALPLPDRVAELYGEFGEDPDGRRLETFGLSFPRLYYDYGLSLRLERAYREDYDTLTSLHGFWEWDKRRWLVGVVDHSKSEGTRVGVGLMFLFEGF